MRGRKGCAMTVVKIAAGVLLGNLLTALIFWIVLSFVGESEKSKALSESIDRKYEQMQRER